jgi:hypothetical protein
MKQSASVFQLSRRDVSALIGVVGIGSVLPAFRAAFGQSCELPPRNPIEGPYFFGDPEERDETGSGLVISGIVRDSATCQILSGARIIRWHANAAGVYEEFYRAEMKSRSDGTFRLSTIKPGAYANLDPHVHWYVTMPGYQPVVAQAQWRRNTPIPDTSSFDFSLKKL